MSDPHPRNSCLAWRATGGPVSAPLPSATLPANDTTHDAPTDDVPPELLPFVDAMIDLCIEKLVRPLGVGSQPLETDR